MPEENRLEPVTVETTPAPDSAVLPDAPAQEADYALTQEETAALDDMIAQATQNARRDVRDLDKNEYHPPEKGFVPAIASARGEIPKSKFGIAPGEEADILPTDPITTWGFVGILLLTAIPVLGTAFLLVWALGGCQKRQKRYYARAALIINVAWFLLGAAGTYLAYMLPAGFFNSFFFF